jgi:hypothetical protein
LETLNIQIKSLLKRKAGIGDHVLELGRNRWFAALIFGLGGFTLGALGNLRMNCFFRRFFLGDFGPPPPDLSNQSTFSGQTVAEIAA